MKRKIKKLLRLLIVFISSFALVCFCLPTKALAQENDGNTYSYQSNNLNARVIFDYVCLVAESLGYYIPEEFVDFYPELKQFFRDYGVETDGLNGFVLNAIIPDINIDLTNQNLIEFFSDISNWDLNTLDNEEEDMILQLLFMKYPTDNNLIYNALRNKSQLNPRTIDNINKYVRYKAYALSRGSNKDILGAEVEFDHWANAQEITFKWFKPEYFLSYNNPSVGGWQSYGGLSFDAYLSYEEFDYSSQPFGLTGVGIYQNGLFNTAMEYSEVGFYITDCRFDICISNNYGGGAVAVYSSSFGGTPIVPISNCHIVDNYIVVPNDVNDSEMRFYVHQNNFLNNDVKIYTENFVAGGVTGPETPKYWQPTDPSSPTYNYDNDVYNYITTETDRILDELDINDIGKILESVDDYGWFTFPLQFYNDIAEIFLDEYSSEFIFDVDTIDLSFVADGLVFPARRFSFNPLADLDGWAFYLFDMLRYIVAFGYFWALVMWGRSLILRIGSDTVHQDYEG